MSPPVTKEVHFFDHEFGQGVNWYRAHFRRPHTPELITGEATPYYLFHPLAPGRVAGTLPDCRLIVLLRDPIDRAYSQHNHERVLGFEELGFEAALAAEPERLAGEEERIRREGGYRSFAHQHHSYLSRGRYDEQVERWLACVDSERILFLSAEDLFSEPLAVVNQAQAFLGLEPESPADMTARNARFYAPIPESVRTDLSATFDPHNRRLYQLVGRDFGWD